MTRIKAIRWGFVAENTIVAVLVISTLMLISWVWYVAGFTTGYELNSTITIPPDYSGDLYIPNLWGLLLFLAAFLCVMYWLEVFFRWLFDQLLRRLITRPHETRE